MLGVIFSLVAALGWGSSSALARVGLQRIRPSVGTFVSLCSSLVLVTTVTCLSDLDTLLSVSLATVLWFALVGVLNYSLGRQFSYLAVRRVGASRAQPLVSASPLFAIILAIIFLKEAITIGICVGAILILAGIYLITSSESR